MTQEEAGTLNNLESLIVQLESPNDKSLDASSQEEKNYREKYPLHAAARWNIPMAIKYLIGYCRQDFLVNKLDNQGQTPLMVAISNNCIEGANFLMKNTNLQTKSKMNQTILHLAIKSKNFDIAQQILDNFLHNNISIDEADDDGMSPLHVAIVTQHSIIINLILTKYQEKGIPLNIRNKQGMSPLHLAIVNKDCETVEKLLSKSTGLNDSINGKNIEGMTPLHLSVLAKMPAILENLLLSQNEKGLLLDIQNNQGMTPLHLAVQLNDLTSIKILLSYLPNLYMKNKNEKTAFQLSTSEECDLLLTANEVCQRREDLKNKLNKNESVNLIDQGAFGIVIKLQLPSGKTVAVKQSKYYGRDRDIVHEIDNLQQFKHCNIVRYFFCYPTDDRLCMFMEFVEGPTLRSLIVNRTLTALLIHSITKQLVECLDYLKSERTLHRDIKPENIIIRSKDNVVKLIDFGIAKIVEGTNTSKNTANVGTPGYEAPEVLQQNNEAWYSYKIDIWSLGIVFAEMWTNDNIEKNEEENWQNYINDKRLMMLGSDGVNKDIVDFFDKCVQENQKDRAKPKELLETNYLRHPVQSSYTAELFMEFNLPFKPQALTVIQDKITSYTVRPNKQLVSLSGSSNTLQPPLIIVATAQKSKEMEVYNSTEREMQARIILLEEMNVSFMDNWNTDLVISNNYLMKSNVCLVGLNGEVKMISPHKFSHVVQGLCVIKDSKLVAVCDKWSKKVVILSLQTLEAVQSVDTNIPPMCASQLSTNQLVIGGLNCSVLNSLLLDTKTIHTMSDTVQLETCDITSPDPESIKTNQNTILFVLGNESSGTRCVHQVHVDGRNAQICGTLLHQTKSSKWVRMSVCATKSFKYLIIADEDQKKLVMYKILQCVNCQ